MRRLEAGRELSRRRWAGARVSAGLLLAGRALPPESHQLTSRDDQQTLRKTTSPSAAAAAAAEGQHHV